jgi:hypothetical protein
MLEKGTIAPEFALTSDDGKEVSLSDFRGKKVILYFYPLIPPAAPRRLAPSATPIPASKGKTSW